MAYLSDCCCAPVYNEDIPLCSDCKEWCEIDEIDLDEEEDYSEYFVKVTGLVTIGGVLFYKRYDGTYYREGEMFSTESDCIAYIKSVFSSIKIM